MVEDFMKDHIWTYSRLLNKNERQKETDENVQQIFEKDLSIERLKKLYKSSAKKA